jgi:hypothetical protein
MYLMGRPNASEYSAATPHILGSRPGRFADLANMSGWTQQNCCNDLRRLKIDLRALCEKLVAIECGFQTD